MKVKKSSVIGTGVLALALALSFAVENAAAAKKSKKKRKGTKVSLVKKKKKKRISNKRRLAANRSSVRKKDVQPTFLSRVGATYYGHLYGPAISQFDDQFPNESGEASEPIFIYNSAKATYKLTNQTKAWINPRWNFRPSPGNEDLFTLLDPRIGWSTANFINQDGLTVSPSIDFELGVTEGSRKAGRIIAPRLWLTNNYVIPGTRLSVGGYLAARYYFRESDAPASTPSVWTLFSPWVSYQVSPKVMARLMYEVEGSLTERASPEVLGGSVTALNTLSGPNLQPAVLWDITPSINLAPYLRIYTSEKISADSTSAGVEFSASIL